MATADTRQFSREYSGLINQSVFAICVATICVTSFEIMRRKRRKTGAVRTGLGSVESWEFGYLYQARSWARNPSPPHVQGLPLSWIKQALMFPEDKMNELCGVDASVYCRFLRGCFWFVLLHSVTTAVILLPIHIHFADPQYPKSSMNRALISSLVTSSEGKNLLWIHLCLLIWLTLTWIYTLIWICRGNFEFRAARIERKSKQVQEEIAAGQEPPYVPHPHPQHPFHAMPPLEPPQKNRGLRKRTVMVTNVPTRLRSEKELKEYFEYYLSRPLEKPAIGVMGSSQPGLINKLVTHVLNRAKTWSSIRTRITSTDTQLSDQATVHGTVEDGENAPENVEIERVVIARKMTELASLLDRREDVLRKLETAHIKLARMTLSAVKTAMHQRRSQAAKMSLNRSPSTARMLPDKRRIVDNSPQPDLEQGSDEEAEDRMSLLIRTLGPFVDEFGMDERKTLWERLSNFIHSHSRRTGENSLQLDEPSELKHPDVNGESHNRPTVWDALFSLPRSTLDPHQPLIHLSALFRGKTVPAIDYYTTKLNLLTSLISESRGRPPSDYSAASTAFVTFTNPDHARKACTYLAVHPKNPLACFVTMAPDYEDLDWMRVMKSTFRAEFIKDWVVDIGVWAFTIAWIIPVSLLVALVSINNIASLLPGLSSFLDRHDYLRNVLTNFVPTLFTSLLILLVPLILLLLAKKAHTINTLSALHDRIMTRYHKFLIANILVFFCVGVASLESFFTSFRTSLNIAQVVGESFPTAGPFYVGWVIFTTAIHGGLEIGLFGLPLIVYPATKRQITPRKRAVGIRPRTFNYYYWLPNHLLVLTISIVFSILNPLLLPFSLIYFAIENVVIKNQLLHVYAKVYEGNGSLLLIRLLRYSLDGLVLSQAIFLAFMVVLKEKTHTGISAVVLILTVFVKIILTRNCRAKIEEADVLESHVVNGMAVVTPEVAPATDSVISRDYGTTLGSYMPSDSEKPSSSTSSKFWTLKFPRGFTFSYSAVPSRVRSPAPHKPNPFKFPEMTTLPSLTSEPIIEESQHRLQTASFQQQSPISEMPHPSPDSPTRTWRLVTPHEKHPRWDDETHPDVPYDNPYYVRPVASHLWLPRNPVGLLDMDDTVDVFKSLTCETRAGQLGEWMEEGVIVSGLSSFISDDYDLEGGSQGSPRQLTGDEHIELPSAIAARVGSINREDVENAEDRRSFFSSRRPSSAGKVPSRVASSSSGLRERAKTIDDGWGRRTVSGATIRPKLRASSFASQAPPSPSILLQGESSPPATPVIGIDPASRPDLHAQSRFVRSQPSLGSPDITSFTQSGISLRRLPYGSRVFRPSHLSSPSIAISAHEAVVNEVLTEEAQATEDRVREEEAERKGSERLLKRSWLTSWMFSNTSDHAS